MAQKQPYARGGTASDPDLLPGLLHRFMPATADYRRKIDARQFRARYIRIDRDPDNRPSFTASDYQAADSSYFYPASTVKLPLALAALEKLHAAAIPGLDTSTPMTTGPEASPAAVTVAACIEKIFLVSDNAAANNLYDFLGPDVNRILGEKGYAGTRILHRFGLLPDRMESPGTPALFFEREGRVIREQPGDVCTDPRLPEKRQEEGPGLSGRNRTTLADLLDMLRFVLFPETCPPSKRFGLSPEDHVFLQSCMSRLPSRSLSPAYRAENFAPASVKFLLAGGRDGQVPEGTRIFNKCGWALGFLTDAAYICDFKHQVEFMLAASLRVGDEGQQGEDHYPYREGRLLLGALGQHILDHELKRPRKYFPNLSRYHFFSRQSPNQK